jgi:hypothetical protein
MGWATAYLEKLRNGETIRCRPRGHSMKGKIESGQLCTIEPINSTVRLDSSLQLTVRLH